MAEGTEEITPQITASTFSELGKRGAAIRWGKEKSVELPLSSRQVRQQSLQTALKAVLAQRAEQLAEHGFTLFSRIKEVEDPEAYIANDWARRIPKEWEAVLDVAKQQNDPDMVVRILTAMTAMTPALSPLKLRQIAQSAANDLPGDMADLSAADDEMLAKLTGKRVGSRVNAVEGSMPRRRGKRKSEWGREPGAQVEPDLGPDTPTKKISSKSKKKAKRK